MAEDLRLLKTYGVGTYLCSVHGTFRLSSIQPEPAYSAHHLQDRHSYPCGRLCQIIQYNPQDKPRAVRYFDRERFKEHQDRLEAESKNYRAAVDARQMYWLLEEL
jgi:hypothetical protein